MADDNLKLVAAVAAAGSIGGFGGHTIGSGVDGATIEAARRLYTMPSSMSSLFVQMKN